MSGGPAVFLLVLFVAGAFVWLTSGSQPAVVASHFGPGGAANGFTSKGMHTALMLALVVGLPTLVASTALLVRILPPRLINLSPSPSIQRRSFGRLRLPTPLFGWQAS